MFWSSLTCLKKKWQQEIGVRREEGQVEEIQTRRGLGEGTDGGMWRAMRGQVCAGGPYKARMAAESHCESIHPDSVSSSHADLENGLLQRSHDSHSSTASLINGKS